MPCASATRGGRTRRTTPRYRMLNPAVWQSVHERQRALLGLFARAGLADLSALRLLEVGCGSGGNLLELLRMGFAPEHLFGIELLPERCAQARHVLPAALALIDGDAVQATIAPESLDIVYVSTVFSSLLDDGLPAAPRRRDVALAQARRRRAVVRLHGRQSAQRRRARGAVGTGAGVVPAGARDAHGASRSRRRSRARCAVSTRPSTLRATRCPCCARTCCAGSSSDDHEPLPFLPFALPEIGEEEIAEVVDTLRSGWITTGPKARRFEEDFAAFLGDASLQAIAVNSATAGLHLALEALGIGPGDEVITTTHTFTATAEVVRYLGADVVLVDIDPATLNIDPRAVEAAITPRTKAIVPVHYAGLAADMPALLAHRAPARPEGRRGRGARAADDLRRRARRHARERRLRVQLLRQQDHHDRRGRHARHARRGAGRARARSCACTA